MEKYFADDAIQAGSLQKSHCWQVLANSTPKYSAQTCLRVAGAQGEVVYEHLGQALLAHRQTVTAVHLEKYRINNSSQKDQDH